MQVAACALVVLALLGLACEKMAAQPPPPVGYFEKERRAGDNGFGLQNYTEVSTALAAALEPDTLSARKIVRNGALDLLVNDVAQSVTKIGSPVARIHWRPLGQAKIAVGEVISGLADWADSIIAFHQSATGRGLAGLHCYIGAGCVPHSAFPVAQVRPKDKLANPLAPCARAREDAPAS